jgi:hypothetical protein
MKKMEGGIRPGVYRDVKKLDGVARVWGRGVITIVSLSCFFLQLSTFVEAVSVAPA